jgi:hypothetical protein
MGEIISVILLLFVFWEGGHKLYAWRLQIFKYGPDWIIKWYQFNCVTSTY